MADTFSLRFDSVEDLVVTAWFSLELLCTLLFISHGSMVMAVRHGIHQMLNLSKIKYKNCKRRPSKSCHFQNLHESSSPLFKKWKIIKIEDMVEIQNCVFVHYFVKVKLCKSFTYLSDWGSLGLSPVCSLQSLSSSSSLSSQGEVVRWS